MDQARRERTIRLYFDVSVALKGLVSLAEVVAGVLVLFIPLWAITNAVIGVLGDEASDGDFIAGLIVKAAGDLSVQSGTFVAVYLLSRGLIKLALVVALLRNQLWAYPSSLVVLGLFVLYQVYQFFAGHSLFIALLTAFDLVVMYFIWREWQILRARPAILARQ